MVENSYVASQKYNGWLAEAREQEAPGWDASVSRRADGLVVVTPVGAPEDTAVTAIARRPLGEREVRDLTFTREPDGGFVSTETLDADRWTLRVTLADEAPAPALSVKAPTTVETTFYQQPDHNRLIIHLLNHT